MNWTILNTGTTAYIRSLFFPNKDVGYAACHDGTVLKTTDAGATWSIQNTGTTAFLTGICFRDQDNGYVVGSPGIILITSTGGQIGTTICRVLMFP